MKLAPTKISGEDCRRRFQEKFTGKLWKKFVKGELQTGLVDGQNKDREKHVDIEKHGGGMMMFIAVLLKTVYFGQSGNRQTIVETKIMKST